MSKKILCVFVLFFSFLCLRSTAHAQPSPTAPQAPPSPPPSGDVMMPDPATTLVCGTESICEVQSRHSEALHTHEVELAALRAQVTRLVQHRARPASSHPTSVRAAPPVQRVANITRLAPLASAIQTTVQDLLPLTALQALCLLTQYNPDLHITLPPGTNCERVLSDFEATRAAVIRPLDPIVRPSP